MNWVEGAGNTTEEAIKEALDRLGVSRQAAEIEELNSGSKGFLGIIGGKQARVRARRKHDTGEVLSEFLGRVVTAMGIDVTYRVWPDEDCWRASFEGRDVRILIGKRGETLNALQLIAGLVINKKLENKVRLILDAEGYRERREETLRNLARRLTERVRRTRSEVTLEPMSPSERRVIHMALQDDPWVETHSSGEEPYRKVIISPRRQ